MNFTGGIRYTGTYGVNPLLCVQGFKDLFIQHGLQVFESTAMERLEGHTVYTHGGSVTADQIIIAADKPERSISDLADEIFHAQTFLSVTEPLNDRELTPLFPGGEQMQCWDSRLVYSYFRLTGDNRLLLGGGTATTFLKDAYNNPGIIKRVIRRFKEHFPFLRGPFLHSVLARPHRHVPRPAADRRQAAEAATRAIDHGRGGSAVGRFCRRVRRQDARSARATTNTRSTIATSRTGGTSSCRAASAGFIGKPLLFSLSNSWAKYYQVDSIANWKK